MSVVYIKNVAENARLGLWEINESIDELLTGLDLNISDLEIFNLKQNSRRKKEWLASRKLLNTILPANNGVSYNVDGKPFLTDHSRHISISHSGDYACVYLSTENPVGVDIQRMKPDISKGADYFLHAKEQTHFDLNDNVLLHILWSAKETVFKYCGIANLDVKKDIHLLPFERNQSGNIEVNLSYSERTEKLVLHYELIDDYVLTRTN